MRRLAFALFVGTAAASLAVADVAPAPKPTKQQVETARLRLHCAKGAPGEACLTQAMQPGKCGWFTWWWLPDSLERGYEGGDATLITEQYQCKTQTKKLATGEVPAFRCLACK